jgi:hypothetical protein
MDKNPWKSFLNEGQFSLPQSRGEEPTECPDCVAHNREMDNPPRLVTLPFSKDCISKTSFMLRQYAEAMEKGEIKGLVLFVDMWDPSQGDLSQGWYNARYALRGGNYGLLGFGEGVLREICRDWLGAHTQPQGLPADAPHEGTSTTPDEPEDEDGEDRDDE